MTWAGLLAGAQMASWMIELQARGKLMAGASVAGAVLRAGGSHKCYQSPPDAVSQCVGCSDAAACNKFGTRSIPNNLSDCSLDVVAEGGQPCCDYCCPARTTPRHGMLASDSVFDGHADTAGHGEGTNKIRYGANSLKRLFIHAVSGKIHRVLYDFLVTFLVKATLQLTKCINDGSFRSN